jgi:ribosomal protein S18 acetylase RimI-like enzyme
VEIRPVQPAEYQRAGDIVVAAYRALAGHELEADYAAQLGDVQGRSATATAEVLVAVDGEVVLGCVTFVPDASSPWAELVQADESAIRMLGVDPAAQGRGVGRALVGACVERTRALGHRALFLHSTPWMQSAHRLYESAGFARVPSRDWLPVPEVPLLAFRLEMGPASAAE